MTKAVPSVPSVRQPSAHDVSLIEGIMVAIAPVICALQDRLAVMEQRLAEKAAPPATETVKEYVEGRLSDMAIDDLRKIVEKLDAETMRYKGVWKVNNAYERGAVVTIAGSNWLALCSTDSKPGKSSDWKLIVKGGTRHDG